MNWKKAFHKECVGESIDAWLVGTMPRGQRSQELHNKIYNLCVLIFKYGYKLGHKNLHAKP